MGTRNDLRVAVTGVCRALDELLADLRNAPGVQVVRDESPVAESAPRLAASEVDLILHATRSRSVPSDELAAIREHSSAPIVLLAWHADADLLDDAFAADLDGLLLLPQPLPTVLFEIRRAVFGQRPRERQTAPGRVATVFSPKGGTGKSVIAVNLAVALAGLHGRRTLLVDLDLQFGDAAIMLGLEPYKTLHDLVSAPGDLDPEKLDGYTTRHGSGLHVLPAPLRPEDAESATDERISRLLEVAAQSYDAVVVDTCPFFHGSVLASLDHTDELLLVCAPDVPTMKNVRLTLQTLELISFADERIRLVLNRTSPQLGLRATDVASVLERRVDFQLPSDAAVPIGVNRGTPAILGNRSAAFSKALVSMAEQLYAPPAARRTPRHRFAIGGRR